jgi:5-methylcytosine-specific restriction endonuclease McrA
MVIEHKPLKCPMCNHILYKRYEGLVCTNWKCKLHFKCEQGWVYLKNENKYSKLFFTSKYDFDINNFMNNKKWLSLKSRILYERQYCEICKTNRFLQVHHILSRSTNPELAMDKENLMVLCEECHKEIHKHDKYKWK